MNAINITEWLHILTYTTNIYHKHIPQPKHFIHMYVHWISLCIISSSHCHSSRGLLNIFHFITLFIPALLCCIVRASFSISHQFRTYFLSNTEIHGFHCFRLDFDLFNGIHFKWHYRKSTRRGG